MAKRVELDIEPALDRASIGSTEFEAVVDLDKWHGSRKM